MLKKMMLLASMAMAAIAVAAPAAHAIDWAAEGTIHGTGSLTSVSTTGLSTGPATVHFTGNVDEGEPTGRITSFTITGPVPTNVPGCTAIGTASNFNWGATLSGADTLTLTNVTFTNHYSGATCAENKVPPTVPVDGTVTLTVTGATAASAEPYNDNTTLGVEPNTTPGVDIKGTVTWTGVDITGL